MKCPICKKPLKEDTEGDEKYCQGHSIFELQCDDPGAHRPGCKCNGGEYKP